MTSNLKLLVKMWGGSSYPSRLASDDPVYYTLLIIQESNFMYYYEKMQCCLCYSNKYTEIKMCDLYLF